MSNVFESTQQIFEFRGVDKFYFAEVIQDDANGYVCGTPVHIPVQEIGKTTDSASEAHYYDNKAMIVVNSESADTITLTIAPPALNVLSKLIGKSFDATTGMMVDSPRQNKYYAIMYRTKGTDGGYRYVSRLKGQFNIPEETNATENDGTDTNNTQITFTGIYTEHEFTKGVYDGTSWSPAGVKGIVVDARFGLADVSTFFDAVQTPDSIEVAPEPPVVHVTSVAVVPKTSTIAVDGEVTITATVSPDDATDKSVSWSSSDELVATVSDAGVVTGVGVGSATITATTTDGSKTDTSTITVVSEIVHVTSVAVAPLTDSIQINEEVTLTATVSPEDATDKTVSWSSSNEEIATVTDEGVVKGIAAGEATITVTTTDGSKTATSTITVTA